ncbi:S8 family peptidase [Phycicoccus sonneratiae]|uniref:S8 family serine peptidase n=1 Tax=Phycicoccus sonneratiae TaxID=2807628 RepID=A0ABS2CGR2_9MICO|nr:S8 family serine peptidase [Phycicoccus sonneraticus]MBM6399049.1 S8 family serine peptidase [Phycicoccus sonneraticus]
MPRRTATVAVAAALVTGVGGLAGVPAASAAGTSAVAAPAEVKPSAGEWWWSAMGVDDLHAKGTGKGITVAVVDGPIDPTVPELRGKVVSSTSLCNDPASPRKIRPRSATAKNHAGEHATSMAALIAGTGRGTGPGGRGIRGIAPDATIRHYAAMYDATKADDPDGKECGIDLSSNGNEQKIAIGQAIGQAAEDGADVISISLVSSYSQAMVDGLLTAYREGAIVVAGTPNEDVVPQWPGLGNGVLLVNPLGKDGKVTDFAVRDKGFVQLAAPGEDIMAGRYDESGWHSDRIVSGSSIATALVSGGIAAVWSAHPDATAGQVLQAVQQNTGLRAKGSGFETWFRRVGTDLPRVTAPNRTYGWGIFDPADAAAADPTGLPDANPFVTDEVASTPTAAEITAASGTAASASPSASPSPSASSTAPSAAAPAEQSGESGGSVLPVLGGVAVVLLLLAGAAVVVLRRRAGSAAAAPGTTPTDTDSSTSQGAPGAEGRIHR